MDKKPTIAAVVPVLEKRGGVRHFLEIGNVLVDRGYDYTIFSDQTKQDWFKYNGKIADWRYGIAADIVIVGDPHLLEVVDKMEGRIFVWVLASGLYKDLYDPYYGKFPFILINRWFFKDYPEAYLCELGVNTKHFKPKRRRVLFYSGGDRGLHKQGHIIHEQLDGLPEVELVELKDLNNDQLAEAYHTGDYFVAWEMDGGFSNTAAEALASGIPVVTNGNNCEPFMDRVILVDNLREFFTDPMKHNTWESTVDNLLKIIL
jgi:glycosyltransferase involved in cell wall biosynthesis